MGYWLMKSEPAAYSWERLVADRRTNWNGVRNAQASNNLKAMQEGDLSFFYHSNEGLAVVGVMRIVRPFYADPGDATGRYGMVDVEPVKPLATPGSLAASKAEPKLAELGLVRQSRLSVMPVAAADWRLICKMGGIAP